MRTYSTVNEIKTEVEVLYRNATGRAPLTAAETDIVYSAIVDAYQIVLLEYGVENFRFHEVEEELTTVANQPYVDLSAHCYRVMSGTVRLSGDRSLLYLADEKMIFAKDPDLEETGKPESYMYQAHNSDPNILRLGLWPTPDAEYTIKLKALKYPADAISSFPAALNMAIKNKAKSLSCLGLGLISVKQAYDMAYEEVIAKVKDGYDFDGPRHVGRSVRVGGFGMASERRINE